jgi:aminomethyltransferase
VWQAILAAGSDRGLVPCGLGARDTLRLEAGMRLYGNDIDETTTVLEACLGWMVAWQKGEFVGAKALRDQKAAGLERKLVGFEMIQPGIARQGFAAYVSGEPAGIVTSGTLTPFLKKAIGFAYLPASSAAAGTEFDVDIRGRLARARVVPLPFYKRDRS